MLTLLRILSTGFAYAVLGALGLALAIPPGYASPVFPAAGLAIASALCFGNRMLPGVWLGSLTINLFVAWQNGKIDATYIVVAAMVAAGATLQTWSACTMMERWLNDKWRHLETEKDIALFLAVTAPLSCLISSTVGTATLYGAGIVPRADLSYSWWNWWIGDTLGVLIFTPLTLIFLLREESPWKGRQVTIAAPLLLTLCLAVTIFLGVARWERTQLDKQIEDYGNKLAQLLDRRMVAHQEAISSLRRLIEVTPNMSFQQFEYFTRITLRDNRDIFALSFNPCIPQHSRRAFEQDMANKSVTASFMITERNSNKELVPAADRPYYVPVGYIAPLEGNRPAIGFDIHSEPIRRNAINMARTTGKPAVTAPIRLVQENQKRVGVLVLHPAFSKDLAKSGAPAVSLAGFAVGVIKVDEMVQIATRKEMHKGIVFHLTDSQAVTDNRVLFQSDGGRAKPVEPFVWRTKLTMADRQWDLDVFPTMEYLRQQRSWLAWGIGVVGLSFSALLQVMLLAMTGRTAVIQRKVNEQTLELTHAKEQLELLNQSLQQRVEESISELREKDQVLINQGRQAAMGEMIGNIAHQWRQPLNALAMLITNLQFAQKDNELTEEYLNESADSANRLIQKMSTTINDFRNFFSPDKKKTAFSVLQQIQHAVGLVDAAFKNNNITIEINEWNDCTLQGFPNEYSQVLLNLLSNAKDAIAAAGSGAGRITISLKEQDGMGVVTVRDNGGGIPEEILDKIFEPYFSTKSMGTGIGLYMSKMIIERNMNGSITARNVEGGSEFTILTPLAEKMP